MYTALMRVAGQLIVVSPYIFDGIFQMIFLLHIMLHIGNRVEIATNTRDDLQRGVHCL